MSTGNVNRKEVHIIALNGFEISLGWGAQDHTNVLVVNGSFSNDFMIN